MHDSMWWHFFSKYWFPAVNLPFCLGYVPLLPAINLLITGILLLLPGFPGSHSVLKTLIISFWQQTLLAMHLLTYYMLSRLWMYIVYVVNRIVDCCCWVCTGTVYKNKTWIVHKIHRKANCIRKGLFEDAVVQDAQMTIVTITFTCIQAHTHMNTYAAVLCLHKKPL